MSEIYIYIYIYLFIYLYIKINGGTIKIPDSKINLERINGDEFPTCSEIAALTSWRTGDNFRA